MSTRPATRAMVPGRDVTTICQSGLVAVSTSERSAAQRSRPWHFQTVDRSVFGCSLDDLGVFRLRSPPCQGVRAEYEGHFYSQPGASVALGRFACVASLPLTYLRGLNPRPHDHELIHLSWLVAVGRSQPRESAGAVLVSRSRSSLVSIEQPAQNGPTLEHRVNRTATRSPRSRRDRQPELIA